MATQSMGEKGIAQQPNVHTHSGINSNITDDIIEAPSALDDSYEVYKQGRNTVIDSSEALRVRRKIDWHLMPILLVTYGLNYLDKNSVSFASVYGLQAGTHLVGQDYSWLSSIFYFGYFFSQFPAGYLMQRYPVGKFLGIMAVTWGIIIITTPACVNFAGISANRFLLGAAEGTVNPGFVLIMSMWYKSSEQPLRLTAYYSTNGWATMFGGLLGYAMGNITTGALATWMYVFVIFGSISVAWGLVVLFFLPDLPSTAKFLSPAERIVAVDHVAANKQGVKNHHFKPKQAWQAAKDPKTWILFFMAVSAQYGYAELLSLKIPNSALSSFSSIVYTSFGFSALQSQYLQIPAGAIAVLTVFGGGLFVNKYPNSRCLVMIFGNTVCIIGAGLLVGLPSANKWGRLVSIWLCSFLSLGFSMSLTMISSNIAGYTKKQVTAAVLFTGYCVGNIIGPQTFIATESPKYNSAYIAMLVGFTGKLVAIMILYWYMWAENKKRDREQAQRGEASEIEDVEAIEKGMHDITEIDNKGFRYTL